MLSKLGGGWLEEVMEIAKGAPAEEIDVDAMNPAQFRRLVRDDKWTGILPRARDGVSKLRDIRAYGKMNLVVLPKDLALEFMIYCQRNPRAFYIAEATDPGDPEPRSLAPGADLRTDLPRYRVYRNGRMIDEPYAVGSYWRSDSVAFLMGSSASFDWALLTADVRYRPLGAYETSIPCLPSGRFAGPMVVTARAFETVEDSIRAIQISSRHPAFHGAPIHIGDAAAIGIEDLQTPEYPLLPSSPELPKATETVLYWGCGIVGKATAANPDIDAMITHYPARLFLTDKLTAQFAVI
jgi:uncharacterized protein YcsI (UPF0317 family)